MNNNSLYFADLSRVCIFACCIYEMSSVTGLSNMTHKVPFPVQALAGLFFVCLLIFLLSSMLKDKKKSTKNNQEKFCKNAH